MRKTREEKGITLLVLVIIVIVLLFLSAITIGSMEDTDLVGYTQEASDSYEESKKKHETVFDSSLAALKELQNEDKNEDESGDINEDNNGSGSGDITEDNYGDGSGEIIEGDNENGANNIDENYYDISFLDLSTSGWIGMTLPTEEEKLIFMFENSNGEKSFIAIQKDGSVSYFEKMNNENIYSYASGMNQWFYVKTKEFVSTPPSINNVKIITDVSIIDAALRELLDAEEEMYTWSQMTNEQIDKIISLTVHQ